MIFADESRDLVLFLWSHINITALCRSIASLTQAANWLFFESFFFFCQKYHSNYFRMRPEIHQHAGLDKLNGGGGGYAETLCIEVFLYTPVSTELAVSFSLSDEMEVYKKACCLSD